MFRFIVALMVSISLCGCTSLRALPTNDKQAVRTAVKVGDEVSIVAVNGKTYLLTLTAIDEKQIVGIGDNKKVTIRYEQITSMELRRVSALRTAGLTIGILAVTFVVVVAVILSRVDIGE